DWALSVAWSTDGRRLATASWNGGVKVWDATTGKELRSLLVGDNGQGRGLAFGPDGRLAGADLDGTVWVGDPDTGDTALTLKGHVGRVHAVAMSRDGRLASGSADQTVKVWDLSTGKERFTLKGHTGSVPGVAFTPDGARLASAGADGT